MRRLTVALILAIFNLECKATLETDTLDYAIGTCLTQKGNDGKMWTVAFYAYKMIGPELNYDIHDKELLAVVKALWE